MTLNPNWFPLSELSSTDALRDISYFTNGFQNLKADAGFVEQLYNKILRKPTCIVGYLMAPPLSQPNSVDVLKKVIGQNGYFLKFTTTNCGIYFIWYNPTLNNLLFWAPNRFTIIKAMKVIRSRLTKYKDFSFTNNTSLLQNGNEEDEDEYAGMPDLVPNSGDEGN
jgi:hypothetical protein